MNKQTFTAAGIAAIFAITGCTADIEGNAADNSTPDNTVSEAPTENTENNTEGTENTEDATELPSPDSSYTQDQLEKLFSEADSSYTQDKIEEFFSGVIGGDDEEPESTEQNTEDAETYENAERNADGSYDVKPADYDRSEEFPTWIDVDGNGCDPRNVVLQRDLENVELDTDDCTVLSGTFYDPASGITRDFQRGNDAYAEGLDIDHILAVDYAWNYGEAWSWTMTERIEFANDLDNLVPMDPATNRQDKSNLGPADWTPADEDAECEYADIFYQTAQRYDIEVAQADAEAVQNAC